MAKKNEVFLQLIVSIICYFETCKTNIRMKNTKYVMTFILSLSILSCQTDHQIEVEEVSQTNTDSKQLKSTKIFSKEVQSNERLNVVLTKTEKFQPSNFSKTHTNTTFGFTVNTEEAMYTTRGDYHSYTFEIHREEPNGLLENLLISLQSDGSYKTYLISYALNDLDYQAIADRIPIDDIDSKSSVIEINVDNSSLLSDLASREDDCDEKILTTGPFGFPIIQEISGIDCEEDRYWRR